VKILFPSSFSTIFISLLLLPNSIVSLPPSHLMWRRWWWWGWGWGGGGGKIQLWRRKRRRGREIKIVEGNNNFLHFIYPVIIVMV